MRRIRIGCDTVSVYEIDPDMHSQRFGVRFSGPSFPLPLIESGLRGPQTRTIDESEALKVAIDFLGAAAESMRHPDSDNRDLFSEAVMRWADDNSTSIECASLAPRFSRFA
jgi:hypothetical protein